MWANSIFLVTHCFIIFTAAESTEDELTTYTGSYTHYAPSTLNFQDIYTNTLLAGRDKDPEVEINTPTQFVEFHPRVLKISRLTPPPKLLLNSSFLKKNDEEKDVSSSTTEDPEPIRVIPIRNQRRGVLDVLFPAARVRTFKNIFDTFRRMLSHTFRK